MTYLGSTYSMADTLGSDTEWDLLRGGSRGIPEEAESPRPPAPEAGRDPVLEEGRLIMYPPPPPPPPIIIMEPGLDIMSPYLTLSECSTTWPSTSLKT